MLGRFEHLLSYHILCSVKLNYSCTVFISLYLYTINLRFYIIFLCFYSIKLRDCLHITILNAAARTGRQGNGCQCDAH
eukprot:COSAG02_NODE_39_length_48074_cov_106.508890_8_plen_78_part_00